MTGVHAGLVLSLVTVLARQEVPPSKPDATSWPIQGVLVPGAAGVTMPALIREVKPQYTAAAMRERIQGVAVLQCVVETDGLVGPVRIVRSLDAVHGLDDEAIRTVRQWRFKPGTKDGVPVRVAVSVEISFTIRDSRATPTPILGWPDSFADRSEVPGALPEGWSEESLQTPTVELRVAYPAGWSIRKETGVNLARLQADDAGGHRAIMISQPGPAPFRLVRPLPESTLKAFLDGVGQMQAARTLNVKTVQSGQVQTPDGVWIWLEMAAPLTVVSGAPAEIVDHMRAAHDGMRMWSFTTTAGAESLSVFCTLLHAANTSDGDKQEEIRRAGLEFGAMLKRMSVRTR